MKKARELTGIHAITKMEAEIIAAGLETFLNGLFTAMRATERGGYLKSITSSVETHGAVIELFCRLGAFYNEATNDRRSCNDRWNHEQFYTAN